MILVAILSGFAGLAYACAVILAWIIITEPTEGTGPTPWYAGMLAAVWPLTVAALLLVVFGCLLRDVAIFTWNYTIRRR